MNKRCILLNINDICFLNESLLKLKCSYKNDCLVPKSMNSMLKITMLSIINHQTNYIPERIHLKHWCIHLDKSKHGIFCSYWFHTKIDYQFDCKNCTNIEFEF